MNNTRIKLIIMRCLVLPGLLLLALSPKAQYKALTVDDCISIAVSNNLTIKTSSLELEQSRALLGTAFELPRMNLGLSQDPTSGGNMDNSVGISQNFSLPVVYARQKRALQEQTQLAEKSRNITTSEVILQVKEAYYNLVYCKDRMKILAELEKIYTEFNNKASTRFKTGETSNLERLAAQNKNLELQLLKKETAADIRIYQYRLQEFLDYHEPIVISDDTLKPLPFVEARDSSFNANPLISYYTQARLVSNARVSVEKSRLLPELMIGYNHQFVIKGFNPAKTNRDYFGGTRVAGLLFGVNLPVFAGAFNSRIKAEKISTAVVESKMTATRNNLESQWNQGYQQYLKHKLSVEYYQQSGLQLADEQLRVARFAFDKGEIGYVEFIQNITAAIQTRLSYLSTLRSLNDAVLQLQYLQGGAYSR